MPAPALPKVSSSFPQVHRTIKYPLKWKKGGFLYFKFWSQKHLWNGSFKEKAVTSVITSPATNFLDASSTPCSPWNRWPETGRASFCWHRWGGHRALFCKWVFLIFSGLGLRGLLSLLAKDTVSFLQRVGTGDMEVARNREVGSRPPGLLGFPQKPKHDTLSDLSSFSTCYYSLMLKICVSGLSIKAIGIQTCDLSQKITSSKKSVLTIRLCHSGRVVKSVGAGIPWLGVVPKLPLGVVPRAVIFGQIEHIALSFNVPILY